MSSGEHWQDWVDKAIACPPEFAFGTTFILPDGSSWVCMDRGGAIQTLWDGTIWLDLLTEHAMVPYGSIMTVYIQE